MITYLSKKIKLALVLTLSLTLVGMTGINHGQSYPSGSQSKEAGERFLSSRKISQSELTSTSSITEITKLTAIDGLEGDALSHVAIDGDTLVVGATLADVGGNIDQGAAYVFYRNQGGANNWGFVKKLVASDGTADNLFGITVSISGDTIVVGAYYADGGGAAYVYYRNHGGVDNWGEVKKLTASGGGETFGIPAIDGDIIIVGDNADYLGEPYAPGSAYIYYRDFGGEDNWGEVKKLSSPDGAVLDFFGTDVTVSGDLVAIGAPLADDQGACFLFSRNQGGPDNWGFVKKLSGSDGGFDGFGYRVAADGDNLVVSAIWADIGINIDQGAVYLFNRNQGGVENWGEVKKLTASDGEATDRLSELAIDGELIVAGARRSSVGGNANQGSAYIYKQHEGGFDNWGEMGKLTASDGKTNDRFGNVTVSGNTVVVGASQADVDGTIDQGAVYVYYLLHEVYLPVIVR